MTGALAVQGASDPETLLLARLAAGEQGEPLERLIERYSGPLFGLGMKLLGDRGMAEELVQDSFVRLWRSAPRFDPARGTARTFIYTLARRAAIDLRRRASHVAVPAGAGEEGPDPTAADSFERLLTGMEVRDAMTGLSESHRQVLELFYDRGWSQQEIADRLAIPLGTVKTRAYHALRALRAEFEKRGMDV